MNRWLAITFLSLISLFPAAILGAACPAGTHRPHNATLCFPCPLDTFSPPGPTRTECLQCPTGSSPGGTFEHMHDIHILFSEYICNYVTLFLLCFLFSIRKASCVFFSLISWIFFNLFPVAFCVQSLARQNAPVQKDGTESPFQAALLPEVCAPAFSVPTPKGKKKKKRINRNRNSNPSLGRWGDTFTVCFIFSSIPFSKK